ncbi:MAG TPA: cytochrome b/b6 domain-containing protein [Trinickia sp.]
MSTKSLRGLFFGAHHLLAYAMIAFVVLHIAGALKHAFVDRDALLGTMLPQRTRSKASGRRL